MRAETRAALLTTGEAARILVVCPDTVREFVRRGRLQAQRTLGGLRLFDPADVEQLAAERARNRRAIVPELSPEPEEGFESVEPAAAVGAGHDA